MLGPGQSRLSNKIQYYENTPSFEERERGRERENKIAQKVDPLFVLVKQKVTPFFGLSTRDKVRCPLVRFLAVRPGQEILKIRNT